MWRKLCNQSRRSGCLLFLAFWCTIIFSSCQSHITKTGGSLIITDSERISLAGEWEFYWDQLLDPDADFDSAFRIDGDVPGSWNRCGYSRYGKATYRLVVEAPKIYEPAIFIPKIYSASKVWVNGALVSRRGNLNEEMYENFILENLVRLIPAPRHEIVIQVANYDFPYSGIMQSPEFGDYDVLYNRKTANESLHLFWIGFILIMAVVHLILYFTVHKIAPYLYISIFGSLLVCLLLLFGNHFIYYFLKSSGWLNATLQIKLYLTFFAFIQGISIVYIRSIFPSSNLSVIGKYVSYFFLLWGVALILIPLSVLYSVISFIWLAVAVGFAYLALHLVSVYSELKKKRNILQLFGLGLAIILSLMTLSYLFIDFNRNFLTTGLSIFLILQYFYLAQQYGVAFLRSEKRNKALDEMVRDRTRKIIAQNEELEKQAAALGKLDATKNKFYENVGHDLRTPLMLIEGYVHRIEEDDDTYLSSKSTSLFKKLLRNLSLITSLNDQMYDLTLLERNQLSLNYEKVNLTQYVQDIVDLFQPKAQTEGKNLKFKGNLKDEILSHLDKHQFSRVLFNILNNALQHTPEDGMIIVLLQAHKANDGFTIGIYNTGRAISNEVLPHLFDRFYSSRGQEDGLRSNVKGMGIGLELAKEITLLHGGSIIAESLNRYGTCFFISLPYNLDKKLGDPKKEENTLPARQPQVTVKKDTQTVKVDSKKANILLVDDNQDIRDYIKEILEKDYAIDEAENGQVALAKIDKGYYDLVISDLMMPWDGWLRTNEANE